MGKLRLSGLCHEWGRRLRTVQSNLWWWFIFQFRSIEGRGTDSESYIEINGIGININPIHKNIQICRKCSPKLSLSQTKDTPGSKTSLDWKMLPRGTVCSLFYAFGGIRRWGKMTKWENERWGMDYRTVSKSMCSLECGYTSQRSDIKDYPAFPRYANLESPEQSTKINILL